MIAQGQARLLDLLPQAIDVYGKALASDDLHLATATATKLLEGMHVFSKGGIEETIALANKVSPEKEADERRRQMIALMIDDSIYKSDVYGHPLHPDLEKVKQALDRRAEEERYSSAI